MIDPELIQLFGLLPGILMGILAYTLLVLR